MIRINLLSDREAIRKETSRQQVSIFFLLICLLLVFLGGFQFTMYQKKKNLEAEIYAANKALKELQEKVGEVEKYKLAKKELETKLEIIELLQKGKLWVPQLLDNVGEIIPEKMWLDKLNLSGTQLSMEGFAIDHETIATFMKDLERSEYFNRVELRLTEKKEVEGVGMKSFSLVMSSVPAKTDGEDTRSSGKGNIPGTGNKLPSLKE